MFKLVGATVEEQGGGVFPRATKLVHGPELAHKALLVAAEML